MTLREQLILAFEAHSRLTGVAETTLSTRLLKGGWRLAQLRTGSDVATGTFERVMQWFSDNWPEGADWPESVDRPEPSECTEVRS